MLLTFLKMNQNELDEIHFKLSYMQCLIKYAAEAYLDKKDIIILLSTNVDENLRYLSHFQQIIP